ncbi:MAG: hypothetical protein MJ168_01575 [Clostridia bacterium]|nr:hypothetical protein [Clostridia bacterium]
MAHKKLDDILNNYDVYPLVVVKDKPTTIHIRPLGCDQDFEPGREYELVICALEDGNPRDFPATGDFRRKKVICNENGGFDIEHTFNKEQKYHLKFFDGEKGMERFSVYCVDEDLRGRYPFMGDLHMHTNRSDGNQTPPVVCANYRRYGYDFMVISDHKRYYPSLEAIDAYKDVNIELNIVPGEEVHMPRINGKTNDVHIVSFGAEYSINALTDGDHLKEVGPDLKYRSLYGKAPDIMSYDEYQKKMQELADNTEVPDDVDAVPYASCCWIFDEIRKANGLGIFAHPTWKRDAYHVPEAFTKYMFEQKPFDAFEVLGGERYFEHNGFQTVLYYEAMAKGIRMPIVGSTDSHSSYESNKGAFICETIVFSPENERKALIQSIKDFYSTAVDTISTEYRVVGEGRLVRYSSFLIENYFPIHDELCYEEGRLMKQYITGTDEEKADAKAALEFVYGRGKKLREKYFDF